VDDRKDGGPGFSLGFATQIQPAGGVDDGGDLKAGPKREIASVAPLLRNDWCLGNRLERDVKMGIDADDGPLTMDRAGRLAGGDW
jgi:hypothetical protein